MVEENSRKLLLNTLDKTPLLIGSISSQFSGENSFNGVGKTSSKTTKKSYLKQPPNGPIYRAPKTSRYGPVKAAGRPPGRPPTVGNPTVGLRSTGRSTEPLEQRADSLPVDRPSRPGHFQRAKLSGRSTDPPAYSGVHVCARRLTARSTAFRLRSTGWSTG